MDTEVLYKNAENVVSLLKEKGLTIATAESCTGGLVAATITSFSGVSKIFEMGITSYSCRIKNLALKVSNQTLERFGAISPQCAEEMAINIKRISGADFGLSVTGVAGPDSSEGHPVGYVYICIASDKGCKTELLNIEPLGRDYVRTNAAISLFQLLEKVIKEY